MLLLLMMMMMMVVMDNEDEDDVHKEIDDDVDKWMYDWEDNDNDKVDYCCDGDVNMENTNWNSFLVQNKTAQ